MSAIKFHITELESVDSTIKYLFEHYSAQELHGQVVLAKQQSKGVGRNGRVWQSHPGNIAASIGLHFPENLTIPPARFSLWFGVSIYDAVSELLMPTAQMGLDLKWPNDIHWRRQKLAGVLINIRQRGASQDIILSFGLNIVEAPLDMNAIALKDLELQGGKVPMARELLERVLFHMEQNYTYIEDFEWLRKQWQTRAHYLGESVLFGDLDGEMQEGIALGLSESGALKVRAESGQEIELLTEDLSLRLT